MTETGAEPARYLILLGSNIDPLDHLPLARARFQRDLRVERWSHVYESDAVGAPGMPRFHNQAGIIVTDLDYHALRTYCRSVEADLGRRRTSNPNAPRTIDLDIVLGLDPRGNVRADIPRDPHVATQHHVCVPAAELLATARLPERPDHTLEELALRLGPLPQGFFRL